MSNGTKRLSAVLLLPNNTKRMMDRTVYGKAVSTTKDAMLV
jgi:hypothetical protein